MNIRAICTDIDGTLLDKSREISKKTKEVFARLPKDFPVILASSRIPSAMTHLLRDLARPENPLICYNGGYLLASESDRYVVFDSVHIPANLCRQILASAEGTSIHISLYSADEWYAPQMDQWTRKEEMATKVRAMLRPNKDIVMDWQKKGQGAHKVMCMGDTREIQWLFDRLSDKFSSELYLYRSKDTYIEIAPRKISKATALEKILASHYGLSMRDVMAFGDNYNDIDLLRAAGLGVAVENAREEVKAVADSITTKNTEDGVALAIENYLL